MKILISSSSLCIILIAFLSGFVLPNASASPRGVYCETNGTRCEGFIECPDECPTPTPPNYSDKACYVNCDHPQCKAQCRNRKPSCDTPGSACFDPRFIGGDGVVFYFHGKSNEHFSLVSDSHVQINGRFMGHRPAGRTRDFTWIQALGILFNAKTFSLEATKSAKWDNEVDHLKLTYNGKDLVLPERSLSSWYSPEKDIKVERISSKNSVIVTLEDTVEILVNIVPITKEDDKVHKYQVPANDCFAHLEVQFRFLYLSPKVEGVLGRTYQPDFENPAKPGVAMPVLGGEEKYRTENLLSPDCQSCIYTGGLAQVSSSSMEYGTLDCTHGASAGYGIVCKK